MMAKRSTGKIYFNPILTVTNTDPDMIAKVMEIYLLSNIRFHITKSVPKAPKGREWKERMDIRIFNLQSAQILLNKLVPYLVNKKGRAKLLLHYVNSRLSHGKPIRGPNGHHYTTEEKKMLNELMKTRPSGSSEAIREAIKALP